MAAKSYHKTNSFASQDWDLLSCDSEESSLPLIQERLSVASLSSEESDTVVIFGGNNKAVKASLTRNPSSRSNTVHSDGNFSEWEAQHEKLLSDISKDPILQRVVSQSADLPVEKRLFEQIRQLQERLDEAQEQAQGLIRQNEHLQSDNTELKEKLEKIVKFYTAKNMLNNSEKGKSASEIRRASFMLAAGVGILLIVKKPIIISSLGTMGTLMLAGSLGVYGCFLNDKEEKIGV